LRLIRVEVDPPLHPERGIASTDRMVLVADRRTEERHDPVTHHLVHGPFVVMDRLHHPLENGIKNLSCVLWVTVGKQLHGAFKIGEEDGDLLALALEGSL
jgi:hypothetical protein